MNGIESDFIHLDPVPASQDPVASALAGTDSVQSSVVWNARWQSVQSSGPESSALADAAFFILGVGEKLSADIGLGSLIEFHSTGTRPRVLLSLQPGSGDPDHFRTLCLATTPGTDTHALAASLRRQTS